MTFILVFGDVKKSHQKTFDVPFVCVLFCFFKEILTFLNNQVGMK